MKTIENTIPLLEAYNALIKYKTKAYKENVSDGRRIKLSLSEGLPDIDTFRQETFQMLESGAYPDNFIYLINRLYLLSEANSDLLAEHNPVIKQLYREYPITKELEQLSFGIYEFLRDEVFHAENEYGRRIQYSGLEFVREELPEFTFRNNRHILWSLYYFLPRILEAYSSQEQEDFNSRILYYEEINKAIVEELNRRADEIIELSKDFCDRNFIFAYLKGELSVKPYYFTGVILSELLESLSLKQYAMYAEFDYSVYSDKYKWDFGKKSLNRYPELASLPEFKRLVQLLSDVAFILQLSNKESIEVKEVKTTIIFKTRLENTSNTEPIFLLEHTEEIKELETIDENRPKDVVEQVQLDQRDILVEKRDSRKIKPEYLLAIPILNLIYEEFTDELWYDITLMEFLNLFTTAIEKQEDFKLRPKQTARFYYLLRKIWVNCDQSLFNSEKEWVVPFLINYNLSYSAYTNQFIKNEGGLKHRDFIRSVDKILPKEKES